MPTAINKHRLLNQVLALHKKQEPEGHAERPVLEQFIYGICRENATRAQADRAYRNLREHFFDWNEIRVSSAREVEEALAGLPEGEARAQRLIGFLQEVFETTFSFDLEKVTKKGLKEASRQLAKFQAANDYVVAWVVQQTLGGHAIPLDPPTLRCVRRLGLIDSSEDDLEAVRASLEHLVPKARGPLFVEVVSNVAGDYCWEEEPNCAACPLAQDCPVGQE